MLKKLLVLSLCLNVAFCAHLGYRIQKRGGISYLQARLSFSPPKAHIKTSVRWKRLYADQTEYFRSLPNTPGEIVFVGDSLISFGRWTEDFGDLRIKNRGIEGDTTTELLTRLSEVTESNPAVIFLMIGINDLTRGRSVDELVNNYLRIMDRLKAEAPEATTYVQSILPVHGNLAANTNNRNIVNANEQIKRAALERGLHYIDLHSLFIDSQSKLDDRYSTEGLHLNAAGYHVWKSALERYLPKQAVSCPPNYLQVSP